MKKLISLSLMLSLGLATISPALNAAQANEQVSLSNKQLLAKWWKGGRTMSALTPAEQRQFNALKRKFGITAIAGIAAAAAAAAAAGLGQVMYKEATALTPIQRASGIVENLLIVKYQPALANNARAGLARQIPNFYDKVGQDKKRAQELISDAITSKQPNLSSEEKDELMATFNSYLNLMQKQ